MYLLCLVSPFVTGHLKHLFCLAILFRHPLDVGDKFLVVIATFFNTRVASFDTKSLYNVSDGKHAFKFKCYKIFALKLNWLKTIWLTDFDLLWTKIICFSNVFLIRSMIASFTLC